MQKKKESARKMNSVCIGLLFTAVSVLLLIGCYAMLLQRGLIGDLATKPVLLLIILLSSTIGVMATRKRYKGKQNAYGIVPAISLALILLLGRMLFPGSKWDGTQGALFVLFAMLPAVLVFGKKGNKGRR